MEYDELAQHLDSLKREECYRVDAVLKRSDHETTQRVYFTGGNGAETGPYIRKFIRQAPGIGVAYERIFSAQHAGKRFKYVPDILECYVRDGQLVVVMEHVSGETLHDVVYRLDPSMALAARIFPQLCEAVRELHEEFSPPIIHRDLKPSNIIMTGGGLAIIDFGIAREFDADSSSDTTHFGTRGFAPPEQFGFGQTTVRSDIYSLGMVLLFCLTEEMPDNTSRERMLADRRVPDPIRRIIAQATAFDPKERFASVAELKNAFANAFAQVAGPHSPRGTSGAEQAPEPTLPGRAAGPGTPEGPERPRASEHPGQRDESKRPEPSEHVGRPDFPSTTSYPPETRQTGKSQRGRTSVAPKASFSTPREKRSRRGIALSMVAIACLVAIIAFAAMGLGNRPHTASSSDAADDAGGAGGRISSPAQAHDVSEQDADAESGSSAEAASSTESAAATAATSSSSNSSTASETPTTAELVSGTQTASPPKNGYDPATNFTVTLAGVDFQIPRYFRAKTLATDGGGMHYYAETGSSVAEIMTSENRVESPESAANPDEWKDSFVTGIMKSGDLFESIVSSIDFELEGFAARLVTFSGTMKGVSVKTKLLVFHDPNSQIVASLIFGQSANAQFDYSGDFAKVVASAKRAESTS